MNYIPITPDFIPNSSPRWSNDCNNHFTSFKTEVPKTEERSWLEDMPSPHRYRPNGGDFSTFYADDNKSHESHDFGILDSDDIQRISGRRIGMKLANNVVRGDVRSGPLGVFAGSDTLSLTSTSRPTHSFCRTSFEEDNENSYSFASPIKPRKMDYDFEGSSTSKSYRNRNGLCVDTSYDGDVEDCYDSDSEYENEQCDDYWSAETIGELEKQNNGQEEKEEDDQNEIVRGFFTWVPHFMAETGQMPNQLDEWSHSAFQLDGLPLKDTEESYDSLPWSKETFAEQMQWLHGCLEEDEKLEDHEDVWKHDNFQRYVRGDWSPDTGLPTILEE